MITFSRIDYKKHADLEKDVIEFIKKGGKIYKVPDKEYHEILNDNYKSMFNKDRL